MIKFISVGLVSCPFDMLLPLAQDADKYQIDALCKVCLEELSNGLTEDTVLEVIDNLVAMGHGHEDSLSKALELIRDNMESMIKSACQGSREVYWLHLCCWK